MAAVLTRILGSDRLEVAEDIVQDTLMKAMETWGFKGVPENPSAWLYAVAKNKSLDFIRSRQRHEQFIQKLLKQFIRNGHYHLLLTVFFGTGN